MNLSISEIENLIKDVDFENKPLYCEGCIIDKTINNHDILIMDYPTIITRGV